MERMSHARPGFACAQKKVMTMKTPDVNKKKKSIKEIYEEMNCSQASNIPNEKKQGKKKRRGKATGKFQTQPQSFKKTYRR
jgi:hypothetical protein